MKQILGDNQFFGINHHDLNKGDLTKRKFNTNKSIYKFIIEATELGLDGFMMNSNARGFDIVDKNTFPEDIEIHYSIPYPHKFASIVNESGMMQLLSYTFRQISFKSISYKLFLFALTRDIRYAVSFISDLEIPKTLPKGSYVYLQNIVTDLILGLDRPDLLVEFCNTIQSKGFKPGLISFNPLILDKELQNLSPLIKQDLIVCFNINKTGFNVFPSKEKVQTFINKVKDYQLMGMSILSSGGVSSIRESIDFIKTLDLDYVVYGSSKLRNIQSNIEYFAEDSKF